MTPSKDEIKQYFGTVDDLFNNGSEEYQQKMSINIPVIKTYREEAFLTAAFSWWISKRPVGWSRDDHLLNPTINCITIAEKKLAIAISDYLQHTK